ncbi:YbcC family protein [Leptospirillum ferrooxidans]|uniref:Probable inorganic carbon transporter subunit DabA n=1 Tax=Leptospirillum ferrooxidans (strain C2-3) TaxID=1162668 RepID=I0IMI9_LEPFC|nr:DUF2309 domain-containing protein [Leptospirillum ferrooxidans]BAM06488.1 hypothetical protein LFE_0773 [Leptospirillum ferrooxidans C2-3]
MKTASEYLDLSEKIEAACQKIAPLWPLKNFVAVNPYFGLRDQPFEKAGKTLLKLTGTGLFMDREYYLEQMKKGQISNQDLEMALSERGIHSGAETFKLQMEKGSTKNIKPASLFSDILSEHDHQDWSGFITERISHYCASYFDEGQALWKNPFRNQSLYNGWVAFSKIDKSPWAMGLSETRKWVEKLPDNPDDCISWAIQELELPFEAIDLYLHKAILSISGWAAWARYLDWQAQLKQEQNHSAKDLLAVRVSWDALLFIMKKSPEISLKWKHAADHFLTQSPLPEQPIESVLHRALEFGYQKRLINAIRTSLNSDVKEIRPDLQAIFCIDVRSEIFRRALEQVAPSAETLGFAGFFGMLVEYLPFGATKSKNHLPILFAPTYRIREIPEGASKTELEELFNKRHLRVGASDIWKTFKTSAASCFSFVESVGMLSAAKLIGNTMGWSRPVAHPNLKGLKTKELQRMSPALGKGPELSATGKELESGIPEHERANVAEFILKNMGLVRNFSPIVLLVGHGSSTLNNPQATGLDCGACAGQTGEVSARVAAALLNDPDTRKQLASDKGIVIPDDTFFIPALHDTTTDNVTLFDIQSLPTSLGESLARLETWLFQAGQISRIERAGLLGIKELSPEKITDNLRRRANDWSEVRPEWGLAGNAAFIAAPRSRTVGINLSGRAFLHNYTWQNDPEFKTLELIMSAPMVVANWINMQYFGSMVDNRLYGSGNKVLHNVVGGSIGVLEGNAGDLRTGLAMQSLHNGREWIHEPIRLHVVIEAPQSPIEEVIKKHTLVRELIENEWLYFFNMDSDGRLHQRISNGTWLEIT